MSKLPSSRRRTIATRVAVGVVAVPALLLGLGGAAQAAELTPVAEYLDGVVADTDADLLEIFTTLLS
ncbi:hypothetical protein [Pseudonocardia abyssalis]|uniref:Uncharacterized protein n=1 Tax=Pseudonocardia abyssalis TaxID=2792008 RepID=A0ABS6UV30_9PSEU|nr:hypothetical protein [Pseudonocardia abyssalis]MBW0114977.1 hypothetical protein [Pseudonocardia abyssalis]MBW0136117.1 hypothetical protein [Pseudonocardia abyssalis]